MSRDLILVALAMMTWGIGEGMFLYFEPLYLEELGAGPVLIGAIIGGIGLAMTISHLPAGLLADRYGRRPLLFAAWGLGTLATWMMALASSLPAFVIASALYGFTSFVIVPLNSYITAARGRWSVGRAITLISAAFNLGAILGPLLGGWIGNELGLRRTFFFAALFFVLSTLIILFIRPQPVEKLALEQKHNGWRDLLNPRYTRYLFVVFIAMFFMYLPQPLSQNFLQNERGVNLAGIGQLIAARSAGVVLLNLVLGQMNARTGFLLAQFLMGLFSLLVWQGTGLPWYMMGYLLLGSYQTARSLATAQGRALIDEARMGLGYGMIETVSSTAIILAPPLAGFLYSQNPTWIYSISLGLIGLAFVSSTLLSPIKVEDIA